MFRLIQLGTPLDQQDAEGLGRIREGIQKMNAPPKQTLTAKRALLWIAHWRRTGFSHCTKLVPVKSHNDFFRPLVKIGVVWLNRNPFCNLGETPFLPWCEHTRLVCDRGVAEFVPLYIGRKHQYLLLRTYFCKVQALVSSWQTAADLGSSCACANCCLWTCGQGGTQNKELNKAITACRSTAFDTEEVASFENLATQCSLEPQTTSHQSYWTFQKDTLPQMPEATADKHRDTLSLRWQVMIVSQSYFIPENSNWSSPGRDTMIREHVRNCGRARSSGCVVGLEMMGAVFVVHFIRLLGGLMKSSEQGTISLVPQAENKRVFQKRYIASSPGCVEAANKGLHGRLWFGNLSLLLAQEHRDMHLPFKYPAKNELLVPVPASCRAGNMQVWTLIAGEILGCKRNLEVVLSLNASWEYEHRLPGLNGTWRDKCRRIEWDLSVIKINSPPGVAQQICMPLKDSERPKIDVWCTRQVQSFQELPVMAPKFLTRRVASLDLSIRCMAPIVFRQAVRQWNFKLSWQSTVGTAQCWN